MRLDIDSRLRLVETREDGYAATYRDVNVIVSLERKSDGEVWIHGSVSRRGGGMPTYDHLMFLKEIAFGPDRTAVQVFPPANRHIDIAGRLRRPIQVLHLWGRYEGNGWLPDMADGGDTI